MLTDARIISALTLRARVTLKRELQRLCRAHSAAAAFLWTATPQGDRAHTVETVGDLKALPRSHTLTGPYSAACEQRTVACADGDNREVVVLYSRLCIVAPTLVLGLVDPRAAYTDVLTDDVEQAIERIESLIVELLDPAPAPQSARTKPARRA